MTSIRKLFYVVLATALMAFALPSLAAQPTKIFSLNMTDAVVSTATPTLTATFANETPNGNSVIGTVILTPPAGVTNVVASFPNGGNQVVCPPTAPNTSGQMIPVPAGSICVANIPNVMKAACTPACSWSMQVSVTLTNTCTAYTWSGQAFTGNSFSGDVFAFLASKSSVTTTISSGCVYYPITATANPTAGGSVTCTPNPVISGGNSTCTATANPLYTFASFSGDCSGSTCSLTNVTSAKSVTANFTANTLTITTAPTSAALGKDFSVTVTSSPGTGGVSLATDTPNCSATSTVSSSTSTTTTFTENIATMPGTKTCTFTAKAANYSDSAPLTLSVYTGVLACGDYDSSLGNTDFTLDPDQDKAYIIDGGSGWGLRRGPNKDGSACVKVNYSCDISGSNIATCTWDKASGQAATFKYVFVWNAVNAAANGWPADYHPFVTWKPGATTPATWPDWMQALACVNDMFPTSAGSSPTWALPIIPNVLPYSDLTTNTYPPYQPFDSSSNPQLAMVCIAQQGWTSVSTMDGSTTSRPIKVQWWVKVIDEADLKVAGP